MGVLAMAHRPKQNNFAAVSRSRARTAEFPNDSGSVLLFEATLFQLCQVQFLCTFGVLNLVWLHVVRCMLAPVQMPACLTISRCNF